MKIQVVKYQNDEGCTRWKITKDGMFISLYYTEDEAIEKFNHLAERLSKPQENEIIVKSLEI